MNKKVKDFYNSESKINKHDDNAYLQLDMTILDLYRFVEWIEEEFYDKELEFEYNSDSPESEAVEVLRYQHKQVLSSFRKELLYKLKDYFMECYIQEDEN